MSSSVIGPRNSKALTTAKLAPKKGRGHCLVVCCWSDPLQLSESQQNHYNWEVCSANPWDAWKTAKPTASTAQQKGSNSSPQYLTAPTLQKLNKLLFVQQTKQSYEALPHLPYPTDYHFFKHLDNFLQENASTMSRRQKMLSKSSSNPEAQIFMLQE